MKNAGGSRPYAWLLSGLKVRAEMNTLGWVREILVRWKAYKSSKNKVKAMRLRECKECWKKQTIGMAAVWSEDEAGGVHTRRETEEYTAVVY